MELIELYNSDTIEQDFHPRKLLRLLLDTSNFPIQKERILFERGDQIFLESSQAESPYVYAIENGVGALYIGKQIIDFVGEEDFIGLHHGQVARATQMHGQVLTGRMMVWRFLLSDVIAKIMSMQEGYLYHYNYMRMMYERYALKIITSSDTNHQKVESMLQAIIERFGTDRTENYIKLPRCFTRGVMANYTGVSNTTLSAVLTQLEKEKIVTFQSRNILVSVN
ncbi:putative cyclic nucleotide-binding proteins (Crp-like) [Listeria grandensis FSL F6-0971]|uniref:Putative cyclic nucleotide-binding proteins (Crp-like) n=1 Tax=Listeria grandensis FSL F6-0971 TaxID=1265819 RepID=W7AU95_9LIST|nr:Crp/Fnr family transcriptional regulator [Listeria grandensis]EUJ18724.1 putative cyclic nucleotide-binding proteins (Crp-like) [Listeria grandensis FSL F6-0971]